ncbi:hypothetical protein D3C81_2052260 [compost metagenome]
MVFVVAQHQAYLFACRAEFQRVVQQVPDDLLQAGYVTLDHHRQAVGGQLQANRAGMLLAHYHAMDALQDGEQIHRLGLEL